MEPIQFPEANIQLGESQPEYITLPVFAVFRGYAVWQEGQSKPSYQNLPEKMTFGMKLSPEEIQQVVEKGEIWFTQLVQGQNFQPVLMSVIKPDFNGQAKEAG